MYSTSFTWLIAVLLAVMAAACGPAGAPSRDAEQRQLISLIEKAEPRGWVREGDVHLTGAGCQLRDCVTATAMFVRTDGSAPADVVCDEWSASVAPLHDADVTEDLGVGPETGVTDGRCAIDVWVRGNWLLHVSSDRGGNTVTVTTAMQHW